MNFNWSTTTELELPEFNKWTQVKNMQIYNEHYSNISEYICFPQQLGDFLGETMKQIEHGIINAELRTAYDKNGKMTGFIMTSHKESYNAIKKCYETIGTLNYIVVNPFMQGCGVGTAMLFDVVKNRKKFFPNCDPVEINALVSPYNLASAKIFESQKFKKDKSRKDPFYDKYKLMLKNPHAGIKKVNNTNIAQKIYKTTPSIIKTQSKNQDSLVNLIIANEEKANRESSSDFSIIK